jgi:hypothetical protein
MGTFASTSETAFRTAVVKVPGSVKVQHNRGPSLHIGNLAIRNVHLRFGLGAQARVVYVACHPHHGTPLRIAKSHALSHRILTAPKGARHGLTDHHNERIVFVVPGSEARPRRIGMPMVSK